MATLARGQTLEEFARQLAELTGAHVYLDRKRLNDAGIGTDVPLPGDQWRVKSPAGSKCGRGPVRPPRTSSPRPVQRFGRGPAGNGPANALGCAGKISLRSGAGHLLRQLGLALVEEPNRLVITPTDGAESRLTLEVYPVADLMFTDQTTPPWLLVNPYLDQQERVRQRLESKLRRKVTIECREQPLAEVVADLAGKIDETVLIDIHALDGIGVGTDAPLTASLGEVTAKQALDWILDDLGLQYTLRDEALTITTPEEAESRLEIRVQSLRDVMYEYPVEPSWLPPELRGWPMSAG